MFRRRKRSTRIRNTRRHHPIEALEARKLLTTISSAGQFPGVLEYKDASGGAVRVVYKNVTAELVFGNVSDAKPTKAVLGNHVLPGTTGVDGKDLFHIFIQKAGIDSYISIARVPPITSTPRPMDPYGGSVSLKVTSARTGQLIDVSGGPGGILLGAKTRAIQGVQNSENHPILNAVFNGLGIFPASKSGKLVAGLSIAPGQDLGRFLFGGTITGAVYVPSGSMDLFYCGALLTGQANGQLRTTFNTTLTEPQFPNNFYVGGDLRNLIVGGSIGTDGPQSPDPDLPRYVTGVDIEIHGRSSQIRAHNTIIAKTWVHHEPNAPSIHSLEQEIETRNEYLDLSFGGLFIVAGSDTFFENGFLGDGHADFYNDTFDNPQFLGVWNSKKLGNDIIEVEGILDETPTNAAEKDRVDYYAVPLMAGQVITARIFGALGGAPAIGVYDPDQRLVATNYATNLLQLGTSDTGGTTNSLLNNEQPFQFRADKSGIYRFAVGEQGGTVTLNGQTVNGGFTGLLGGAYVYKLQIIGAGDLGLGALAATNLIYNRSNTGGALVPPPNPSACVVNGDFGAVYVGAGSPGWILYSSVPGKPDVLANGGNLRAVDALQIGKTTRGTGTEPNRFTLGQGFFAKRGSIGMVRARTGDLIVQDLRAQQKIGKGKRIGGDIHTVQADNGFFWGQLYADRSIGSIDVNDMGTTLPSHIEANADNRFHDGRIDLIDVTGNLGLLGPGGPAILTHSGGNVRYMRAGGNVFRDRFFGGGSPEKTTFVQGQTAYFTDDSGAQIRVEPTASDLLDPATGLPIIDPVTGQEVSNAGTLTATTYPIQGGGVVVMRIQSTRGATITSTSPGIGGTAEIGVVTALGIGAPLIPDPGADGIPNSGDEFFGLDGIANSGDEPLILDPQSTNDNSVLIKGTGTVDVLEVNGGTFNEIRNKTDGEIVNVIASGTVGLLQAATLGLAKRSTPAALRFAGIGTVANSTPLGISGGTANTYPFRDQRHGIVVFGNVAQARSYRGLGNFMIDGRLVEVAANYDGKGTAGVTEGIEAPIYASGNIDSVNIGEGILPTGTGDASRAGLYSHGRIGIVFNQGLGSDIRGDIISAVNIDTITLTDGAIIGATIADISATGETGVAVVHNTGEDLEGARKFGQPIVITTGNNVNGLPQGEISHLGISGRGGIIGSLFRLSNIGPVEIKNGFGIFNSEFLLTGAGRWLPLVTDGYGIRNSIFRGGAFAVSFTARASGKQISTSTFTPSVLLSRTNKFDPYFGYPVNFFTDLYAALGTSTAKPKRTASTYGGAIENSTFVASRDLGALTADRIKRTTVSYGNQVTSITSRREISFLTLTTGRIDTLIAGKDLDRSDVNVAGPIGHIRTGGSIRGSTTIHADGPNGTIGEIVTDTSLYGTVDAIVGIDSIRVGTHIGSPSLHASGNIRQIIVGGSILSGANISTAKTLFQLVVGGDVESGATITARDIVKKLIKGAQLGTIEETG